MGIKGAEINTVQNISTTKSYYSNNVDLKQNNPVTKVTNETQISEDKEKNNDEKEYTKKDVDKAVTKLNKFLEDDKTHAEYSIHKELGTMMIKIIDDKTQKVLLEVPSKKVLDMIASMCKSFGILDKKA